MKKISSLYIHIPFCDSICPYCDFSKVLTGSFSQEQYVSLLLEEIESFSIPPHSLKTIYIGGGTPSVLTTENLERLLSYLSAFFDPVEEFTIEANPESLSEEKIVLLQKHHVNRVSLGVQSVNTSILKTLERKHTNEDVETCVNLLREHGIENINLDFIYGLPTMTNSDLLNDLSFAYKLKPKHLSFYALQLEEGTLFYVKHLKNVTDELLASMYEHVCQDLQKHGYFRYEVSNFALPEYESKHNCVYWHDDYYYAAGLSASGYLPSLRYTNTKSITRYLSRQNKRQEEKLTSEDEEFEYLMLNLRLVNGFTLDDFQKRFGKDFLFAYKKEIPTLEDALIVENGRVHFKPEKLYVMDYYLLKLLHVRG